MPKPLVYLRLFGGVALERDGAPLGGSRATQRRRLALLTLLAAAPIRQLSRDKLLGYLWPESDTEAARHLLAGAVYELRKALGEDAILSRGDDLALNPAVVESDLGRLEAALKSSETGRAVDLYRGPFADGFFVSEAPEFERWLEETRGYYQRVYRELLEAEAQARQQAGDAARAAELWLRLASLDPADSRVVLRAMDALHAAGQSAAALHQARAHASHLQRELAAEPDSAVTALAEQIRRSPKTAAPFPATATAPIAPTAPTTSSPAPATRSSPTSLRGMIAGFVGGVLVLVVVAIVGLGGRHDADAAVATLETVLILPFAVPDSQHDQLRRHLATLLTAALDGAGEIRIVKAGLSTTEDAAGRESNQELARQLAARAGADAYVLGQVEEASGTLRLRARLFARDQEEPLVQAAVTGPPARVAETVDLLVLELLGAWPRPPAERLAGVAARSTRSLTALKAWLGGERAFRAGRFLAAAEAFARATQADSTFALAHYRLGLARLASDFPLAEVTESDRLAIANSSSLEERERLLILAYEHFRKGEAEAAEQRLQSLTGLYPDDVEAWLQLGETRFHYNPLRGLPIAQSAEAFERAAALDPLNWNAQWHLAHLRAIRGEKAEFVRMVDRLLAMNPETGQDLELRSLRAIAMGQDFDARLRAQLEAADELRLFQITWRAAVYIRDLDGAERIARVLASPSRPTYPQMLGRLSLVYLDLARGRWDSAEAGLHAVGILQGVGGQVLASRVGAALLPGNPAGADAIRRARDSVNLALLGATPPQRPYFLLMLGVLNAQLGDSAAALKQAAELERLGERSNALLVRADVAHRGGRSEEALDLLSRQEAAGWYGYHLGAPLNFLSYARYLKAQVLRALDRNEEAERWMGSLGEFALSDLVWITAKSNRK